MRIRRQLTLEASRFAHGDEALFTPARQPRQDWDWSAGGPGPTWTLRRLSPAPEAVLGLAGLNAYQPRKVHLWGLFSAMSRREWALALRLADALLDQLHVLNPGLTVTADARDDAARRCLEKLGFVFEGEAYELDGDHYRTLRKAA